MLMFCVICEVLEIMIKLGNSISLQQNQFLLGTQAFTSPPDMASSGVWKIIILTKTPTCEGVCRMLYFIIFLNFLPNVCYLLTDGKSTFLLLTDVMSTF